MNSYFTLFSDIRPCFIFTEYTLEAPEVLPSPLWSGAVNFALVKVLTYPGLVVMRRLSCEGGLSPTTVGM